MTSESRVLTSAQLRAARALLDWTADELARRTKVSLRTIRRAEQRDGATNLIPANVEILVRELEAAGIVFVNDEAAGTGVLLKGASSSK